MATRAECATSGFEYENRSPSCLSTGADAPSTIVARFFSVAVFAAKPHREDIS
jgi:hypothetical protein